MHHTISTSTRFVLALCLTATLWGMSAGHSHAQTSPLQSAKLQTSAAATVAGQMIDFAQLGIVEQTLEEPFSAVRLKFGLPAYWKLKAGAELQLHFRTFTTEAESDSENTVVDASAGELKVSLNNIRLASVPLAYNEEQVVTIPITTTALLPVSADGRHSLNIQYDNRANCGLGVTSTVVTLLTSSSFSFPFDVVNAPTDLSLLPRPIFQQSFLGERATIVVPDKPTTSELQAALLVAAGFGRMTGDRLAISLLPIAQVTATTAEDAHLIFVGKSEAFPILQTMALRLKSGPEGFTLPDANVGVIQSATSPLTNTHVALVISGNTDEGVVKAGKAFASGTILTGTEKNLALVTEVKANDTPPNASSIDRSFADLGYDDWRTEQTGRSQITYEFDVPLDTVADGEPSIDLFFQAKLPVYGESNMTVHVNDDEIETVQFSEQTTNTTSTRILIPRASIHAGRNEITINATIKAQNECVNDDTAEQWLSIGSNSTLRVPLRAAPPQSLSTLDLGAYPEPFDDSLTLSSTAFVLANTNPSSWRAAVRLASNLASKTNGESVDIAVGYGNDSSQDFRNTRNVLIIGRPAELPIVAELKAQLPAPFDAGSDEARDLTTNAIYRPGETVGYLQLLASPWNERRVVLAVLGNTDEGVGWASTALVSPSTLQDLSGNFAIVIADQVFLDGTRLSSPAAQPTATGSASADSSAAETDAPAPVNRTTEVLAPRQDSPLVALIVSFLIMLCVLGMVLGLSWWRGRRV